MLQGLGDQNKDARFRVGGEGRELKAHADSRRCKESPKLISCVTFRKLLNFSVPITHITT